MTAQQQATEVFSITAMGAIDAYMGVTRTGTQAGAGGGNGEPIIGICDRAAVAGEALRVIRGSTAMAKAGAVIDGTEPRLKTSATGLVPWTTGGVVAAILKPGQVATAAGQIVEVIPVIS